MRPSSWWGPVLGAVSTLPLVAPDLLGLDRRWPGAVLVALRRVTAAVVLVGVGPAAASARWRAPAAGAAGVGAAVLARSIRRDRGARAAVTVAPGRDLGVLVANVWKGRADPLALAGILRVERPDLVVLPEAGERFTERLLDAAGLGDLGYRPCCAAPREARRHRPADPDGPWTTVLLAPSLGDAVAEPARPGGIFGWLEVHGGTLGPVRVLAAHPAAPVPGLIGKWAEELERVAAWRAAHVADGAWPIVAGDLNTTREHRVLARLGRRCVGDRSARAATWPALRRAPRWVGFTIDHVLVTDPVAVRETRVLDVPGSDHRAVLARLVLPPG